MSSDLRDKYPIGSRPAISFVPYIIFCSYLVSLIGAFTTVELLHRRVSGSGWRSWVQVGGCSVSFGLVAIWCMHFVGNRAIILGDGEDAIQLYYSSTYTAVSAILPVVVIFLGLLVADRFYKGSRRPLTRYSALVVCGVCAGAAVTEMHYLGNNGTTNYYLKLSVPHVVGAACIAVGACLISFGLFFHWSGHWVNFIWRRIIVACFLALAVSGMHWTAAAGTWYEIRGYHEGHGQERNINLIIALCLCLFACAVCFLLGFLKQRQQRMLKDRAQQVVLAVATFDVDGRLLVSQGGLMPCQTITRQFHQRTFDDDFNTSHPVFQWLFRVSRNWTGIAELIPTMRDHLQNTGYIQTTSSPTNAMDSRASFNEDDDCSYSATFRELFCVTAQEIARSLDTALQNLGCLYEDVLTTGTLLNRIIYYTGPNNKTILAADVAATSKDIEAGIVNPILFGKGQMLVLTRRVDTNEANRLQNLGYRFANIDQVGDQLARSLQVPREDLENLVARLDSFSKREPAVPAKGTHLAAFLIQPSPAMRGLDVVVPRATPDRLPMVKLSDEELDARQLRLLASFNGLALDDCLIRITQRSSTGSVDDIFLEKFRNRISDLLRDCPETTLHRAIFSARQMDIAHGITGQKEHSPATVFAFCGIKEIYNQSLQSLTLRTIPLSFFQTYLRSYPGCPDHAILAQKNHKEFSSLMRAPSITKVPIAARGGKWHSRLRAKSKSLPAEMPWQPDSSSEKGLVHVGQSSTDVHSHPWGGIMVTSTQNMTVDDSREGGEVEMRDLGVRSEIGMAETEKPTLADRLMSITTGFRDPHSARALPKDLYYGRR
ncbi:hypothetical protein FB567DRAFT_585938 [Paraphoma chrysanthemicola]|uniref:MHYT domain-containing protein n=1 Tax=Paraphoma chrysanthemicola TaxID=798071 RepID=A0A8K0RJL5_9PLEO|nr:hypothetical protein FB567DRAFT_585938 [Paraphoma chrysanthemicola]